jgi:hypothetical protein
MTAEATSVRVDTTVPSGATPRDKHATPSKRYDRLFYVVPLLIAGIGGFPVFRALRSETYAILGRDQGIFQYVAWAISRGERAYHDFREINGPLPAMLHGLFQRLGGEDEHVFRVLDLVLQLLVFGGVGAVLVPRADRDRRVQALTRGAWALAACVIFGGQYVLHGWWQSAQRESFYDAFILTSLALQWWAHDARTQGRGRTIAFFIAGMVSAAPWFGKPTCGLFTILQVVCILLSPELGAYRRRAVSMMTLGALATSVVMIGYLVAFADARAAAQIIVGEVPRLYRYIWKLSLADMYWSWGNAPKLNLAFGTLVGAWALILAGVLPRRFLILTTLVTGGLITFFAQGKGFPYHLHPVTAGTHLLWLGAAVVFVERLGDFRRVQQLMVGAFLVVVVWTCIENARLSAYTKWDASESGATPAQREQRAYVNRFPWRDFSAWDLREAAAFVRSHTLPSERIQTFGMDPYFLFLAQRLSATPYIYSFELDVDAALRGGSGGSPSELERVWLHQIAETHDADLARALEESQPAAFVTLDVAPFSFAPDSEVAFREHCPKSAAWLLPRYSPAARFRTVRVWLRNDLLVRDVSK